MSYYILFQNAKEHDFEGTMKMAENFHPAKKTLEFQYRRCADIPKNMFSTDGTYRSFLVPSSVFWGSICHSVHLPRCSGAVQVVTDLRIILVVGRVSRSISPYDLVVKDAKIVLSYVTKPRQDPLVIGSHRL